MEVRLCTEVRYTEWEGLYGNNSCIHDRMICQLGVGRNVRIDHLQF